MLILLLSVISEDFEFRGRKLATSRFFQTIVLVTKDAKTENNWNAYKRKVTSCHRRPKQQPYSLKCAWPSGPSALQRIQSGMSDLASRISESWINQHPNQPLICYITITLERMNGKTIDPVWSLFQDNPSPVILDMYLLGFNLSIVTSIIFGII